MGDYPDNLQGDEESNRTRMKTGDDGENSTSEKACQTEGPWDTIIVNQIPTDVDYEQLMSVFSQYGNIENTYLCKRTKKENKKHERVARITFNNEEDALKVWRASQEKLIKYDDHVLMVTLTSTDYSPIQNLPDMCLREIFKRVNLPKDKLNIELVCRRWRDHGRCCWSNIKEIELSLEGFKMNTWKVIFSRLANSLEYLNFCGTVHDAEILAAAAEYCVRLERFRCLLVERGSELILHKILEKNEDLLCFQLRVCFTESGNMNFLEALPAGLYVIEIRADNEDTIPATVALSKFQNLRVLMLYMVTIRHHDMFDDVVDLEELTLMYCHIPQASVATILKNNKGLKYLGIDLRDVSDAALIHLQQLPKLQVLVNDLVKFTDAQLQEMGSLRVLSLRQCPEITDEGIRRYLDHASNITHLCLFECATTLQALIIAREWTKRMNRSLTIFVDEDLFRQYKASKWRDNAKFKVRRMSLPRIIGNVRGPVFREYVNREQ